MSEEQQDNGTTGPADEQGAIGADPTRDPATDPTAAPGPDDSAQVREPGTRDVNGDQGDGVTLDPPYPHDVQPGYGVTGKFPTDDAGDAAEGAPIPGVTDPAVTSEPASETDALAVEAPAPVTAELPAAEADQLDVPADQRGDTA